MFFSKSPSLKSRLVSIKGADCYNHQIQKSKSAEEIPKVRGFLKSQRIPPIFVTHDSHCNFSEAFPSRELRRKSPLKKPSKKSKGFFCTRHASLIYFDRIFLLVSEEIHKILLCCCWTTPLLSTSADQIFAKNVGSARELVLKKNGTPCPCHAEFLEDLW